MSESKSNEPRYRQDPISGRWVILAPERANRPTQRVQTASLSVEPSECPFCEGFEERTTPEVLADREENPADGPGWKVRVIPNLFPAVRMDLPTTGGAEARWERIVWGLGTHEVIIECPEHCWSISGHSDEHVARILRAYRERLAELRRQPGLAYSLLFKNAGHPAGATQEHAHSQIIATRHVPPNLQAEVEGFAGHHRERGACILCEVMGREEEVGERVVARTDDFLAWCPYASRFPLEVWIAPRIHESRFDRIGAVGIGSLAAMLRSLLARLERMVAPPAYNYFIHTEPHAPAACFHWHFEIVPRFIGLAGFELGGGMFINPILPEAAAARWRAPAEDLDRNRG